MVARSAPDRHAESLARCSRSRSAAPRGARRGTRGQRPRPARPAPTARRLNEPLVEIARQPREVPDRRCAHALRDRRGTRPTTRSLVTSVRLLIAMRSRSSAASVRLLIAMRSRLPATRASRSLGFARAGYESAQESSSPRALTESEMREVHRRWESRRRTAPFRRGKFPRLLRRQTCATQT